MRFPPVDQAKRRHAPVAAIECTGPCLILPGRAEPAAWGRLTGTAAAEQGETFVFARISYFKGTAPQIDGAIELIRDKLGPSLATHAGFLGSVTLVDHVAGQGLTATYWQSGREMGAAEDTGVAARDAIAERVGAQLTDVDRFELVLQDRVAPPTPGTFVRMTELRGSPDQIEATRALMLEKGIPLLRSQPGYRALLMGVNRASGRTFISSGWATAAEMEASDASPGGLRQRAAEVAQASSVHVTRYEAVLASLSQTAQEAATPATAGA
jgi:hypothetical protein